MESQGVEKREKAKQDIYFISGLGADERVFHLLEFEGYNPVHINWIEPEKGEPIQDYAKRLSEQIKSDNPIIIGLSFGGMVATEIAKQIEVKKIILLSSVKHHLEIPFYYRLFRYFQIYRIFPFKSLLSLEYWLAYWLFGLKGSEERRLLKLILQDVDAHFLKWALHQVIIWNNETIPENLYHIHGKSDRVFPFYFVEADFMVEQAGHLMVMTKATDISFLIEKIIG